MIWKALQYTLNVLLFLFEDTLHLFTVGEGACHSVLMEAGGQLARSVLPTTQG